MNQGIGPDPYNMPQVGGYNNQKALQQAINQAAPLSNPSGWHGSSSGTSIPSSSAPVYEGYSPQAPVNHTGQYISAGVIVAVLILLFIVARKLFVRAKVAA